MQDRVAGSDATGDRPRFGPHRRFRNASPHPSRCRLRTTTTNRRRVGSRRWIKIRTSIKRRPRWSGPVFQELWTWRGCQADFSSSRSLLTSLPSHRPPRSPKAFSSFSLSPDRKQASTFELSFHSPPQAQLPSSLRHVIPRQDSSQGRPFEHNSQRRLGRPDSIRHQPPSGLGQ